MNVYQTDNSGYFVSTATADRDPRNVGNWLIPGGCVTTAPPALNANQAAKWNGSAWVIVPDFRGRVYWLADRSRHEITERGIPLPLGALDAEPPKPLNEVRDAKLTELQAARNAAEAANVLVQGKTFSAEPSIAKRFESLAARLRRGKPTSLNAIFEVDGTPVFPVTQALLEQIEDAIAAQGEAAWNHYAEKVGVVLFASTVEQIDAVAW